MNNRAIDEPNMHMALYAIIATLVLSLPSKRSMARSKNNMLDTTNNDVNANINAMLYLDVQTSLT